jgi:hypothetical protein
MPESKNVSSLDNAIAIENLPKSKGNSVGSESELELSKNVFREDLDLSKHKTVSNLENSVKRIDKKFENHPKPKAFSEIEELCNQKTVSNVEDSMLDESVEKKTAQNLMELKLKEMNKLKAILQRDAEFDDETLKNFNLKKVGKNISISKNVETINIPKAEKTKENQLDEKVPDSFTAVESIKYDYIDGKLIRKKTGEKNKQNTMKIAMIDMPKVKKTEENQLIGMDDLNDEYTLDAYIVGKLIFWQNN